MKEAPACALLRGAGAAARNACGPVQDVELLSRAGRLARAYSLAGLAVEEVEPFGLQAGCFGAAPLAMSVFLAPIITI